MVRAEPGFEGAHRRLGLPPNLRKPSWGYRVPGGCLLGRGTHRSTVCGWDSQAGGRWQRAGWGVVVTVVGALDPEGRRVIWLQGVAWKQGDMSGHQLGPGGLA